MNEESSFLTAIREQPDEDFPRLAFADWLEERGDPRYELIRVQCRLADGSLSEEETPAWQERETTLIEDFKSQHDDFVTKIGLDWVSLKLERGFVKRISLTDNLGLFLEWHEHLFETFPLLTDLTLMRFMPFVRSDYTQLRSCPGLKGITDLTLKDCQLGAEGIASLAHSPYVQNLKRLSLSDEKVDESCARAIGVSPFLRKLTALTCLDVEFGSDAAAALGACDFNLHTLFFMTCNVGDDFAAALGANTAMKSLRKMTIYGDQLTANGVHALARSDHLDGMHTLMISKNQIGAEGARAIAESKSLRSLAAMSLSSNELGDEGASAIIDSGPWPNLYRLEMGNNDISDEVAEQLARSDAFPKLTELSLKNNPISAVAKSTLLQSPLGQKLIESQIGWD